MPKGLVQIDLTIWYHHDQDMGWRIRQVLRTGPFRWNLSRSGVGWSVGIPGLRYGRTPSGVPYFSVGLPGTGVYWIKYLTRKTSAHQMRQPISPKSQHPIANIPPTQQSPNEKLLYWKQTNP